MKFIKPKIFEDAACTAIKNPVIKILVFILVFSVASSAQSLIPTIMAFPYIMKYTSELTDTPTIEQALSIAMKAINEQPVMLANLFCTVLTTIIVILFCKFLEKRPLSSMGFVKSHAGRDYLVGTGVGLLMFSAVVGVNLMFGALTFDGVNTNINIGIILIFFVGYLLQGMSEEVVFRGYLMTDIGGTHSTVLAVFISSLAFGLMHLLNSGVTVLSVVNIFLVGAFLAIYMICFENIWGVCAIHSLWNFSQGHVFGISVSGMAESESLLLTSPVESRTLINGGSFGAEGGLGTTIVLVVSLAVLILYMIKKKKIVFNKK